MARSRRSAPRPAPRQAPAAAPSRPHTTQASPPHHPPPPAPHAAPPPPAMPQQGGGMLSGLGGMVMQGMALGTGSAMAHRAVDAVLGSRHPEPAQAAQAAQEIAATPNDPCAAQAKKFTQCMEAFDGDMGSCQQLFDAMKSCRLNSQAQL